MQLFNEGILMQLFNERKVMQLFALRKNLKEAEKKRQKKIFGFFEIGNYIHPKHSFWLPPPLCSFLRQPVAQKSAEK